MIQVFTIWIVILITESFGYSATITIKPGEIIEIRANKETTVRCESGGAATESSIICHKFYGDSACNGMPVRRIWIMA